MNEPPDSPTEPVHVWLTTTGEDPRATAHRLVEQLAASLGHPAPLHHTATGQPTVDGLHVSLTHTTGVAAVAATRLGPVGIDAELRRDLPVSAMARRWFAPAEHTDDPETFLKLWTAKEAVGKALGRGLRGSGLSRKMPADLLTSSNQMPLIAQVVPTERELAVVHIPGDVVLAVAFPAVARELVLHHGTALRSTVRSRTSFPVVVRGI
ncbi:4'-phosphopantetheinyl transferase superfamily protein [Kribbella sp. NPDC051770]|uniref:4'-phosphopantetheinyl transferase family protein n=1 Tax=Kribbella sp. NPDC051770 TaxID=3155413 RepID=UPI00342EB98D